MNAKLEFRRDSKLLDYCDADWAKDFDERRSCTGFVLQLQNGAISWSPKHQQTIAFSTTDVEYQALSSATQGAMWLNQENKEIFPNETDSDNV